MKIAINCRSFLGPNPTGVGIYARTLAGSLAQGQGGDSFQLYCPVSLFDRKRRLPAVPGKNFSLRRDMFRLGPRWTCGDADIYHTPGLEKIPAFKGKVVVTIHDLVHRVFPRTHTPQTVSLSEEAMATVIERAHAVICSSWNTRRDLETFYPALALRLHVVYPGVSMSAFAVMDAEAVPAGRAALKAAGIEGGYLLSIGTMEPRKNFRNLLTAFSRLKRDGRYSGKLVIAGMKGWGGEDPAALAQDLGVAQDVIFPGYLKESVLITLYNLCDAFVFPSLYEGFGFPIVEAMACGAPVVTSATSSCGEIGKDAARMVDPASADAIAAGIEEVVSNPGYRAQLVAAGRVRAGEFTVARMAAGTRAVYRAVMGV